MDFVFRHYRANRDNPEGAGIRSRERDFKLRQIIGFFSRQELKTIFVCFADTLNHCFIVHIAL